MCHRQSKQRNELAYLGDVDVLSSSARANLVNGVKEHPAGFGFEMVLGK